MHDDHEEDDDDRREKPNIMNIVLLHQQDEKRKKKDHTGMGRVRGGCLEGDQDHESRGGFAWHPKRDAGELQFSCLSVSMPCPDTKDILILLHDEIISLLHLNIPYVRQNTSAHLKTKTSSPHTCTSLFQSATFFP